MILERVLKVTAPPVVARRLESKSDDGGRNNRSPHYFEGRVQRSRVGDLPRPGPGWGSL